MDFFISEHELINVEINKSKIDLLVGNKLFKGMYHLSELAITTIFHISKHHNNTTLAIFLH